jgi:hypothetical protein
VPERYEEVRRMLVARGYLQGRLERFVLRDLLEAYGPGTMARTSGKAALLGAPILGALLAASTVAANRPHLTVRDALVLWGYFGLLSAVALFALDLIAAGLAGAWARRRGARSSDALRAGLIVAVPVLGYLVVLWARGRTGGGFGADLLFLAAATATTGLVAWLAGLVSLASIVGRTGAVPDRNRHFAMLVLAVLVPVAAAYFVLPGAGAADPPRSLPPSSYARPSLAGRLIVVGIDGLDGSLVEQASAAAKAGPLLDLLARGAMFPKHRPAAEPAEVWTTIATGMPPSTHGVRQAGATQLPGIAAPIASDRGPVALDAALRFLLPSRTVPASGAGRRVRTLWEIAGFDRKSAVVGWWASWPARGTEGDPPGYVVSDRVLAKLLAGRDEDRDTAPPALYTRLAGEFSADRDRWRSEFAARFTGLSDDVAARAWESFLIDAFAWKSAGEILQDPAVGSAFVYLPGLDILRTRLAPRGPAAGVVTSAYVAWLESAVIAALPNGENDRIVLIADPGRSAPRDAEGFVAVTGDGVAPSCVGPSIGDLDVAPLVLRLAGLPSSREMIGTGPARCFEHAAPAVPSIATWGRRGRPETERESDYDPEMVERLKSLGYLR